MNGDKHMSNMTIITAFFDINRSDFKHLTRSDEEYLHYFSFWARLRNQLIIYTNRPDIAEKALAIREVFGLKSKTQIRLIEDYTQEDPELYQSILQTMQNPAFCNFRLLPDNPESKYASYNYIMCLKFWCLQDATQYVTPDTDYLAWLDFGFNHGGDYYTDPSQFNFMWAPPDESDKIHLYTICDLDDTPIHEVVCKMKSYIQGGACIIPVHRAAAFYETLRDCMMCLNRCGLADDDQVLLLMAYRQNPDAFVLHKTCWFGAFDFCNINLAKISIQQSFFSRKWAGLRYILRMHRIRFSYLRSVWKCIKS